MKILVLDIETSPNLGYIWGLWDQNIAINQLEESDDLLCFAAKWLGNKKVEFYDRHDEAEMVNRAWTLLDEADAVVHYNGKKFDIPWLNRKFKEHAFPPPSPFKQIDLCNVVKTRFKLPSYKLQYVSQWLDLSGKQDTGGFELWRGVMMNDPKAWDKMRKYNIQDVRLTEEVYTELLPWIPGHPNVHLYDLKMDGCPRCGSHRTQKRGFAYTATSRYQQYQCNDCGSYFRDTKRIEGTYVTESAL